MEGGEEDGGVKGAAIPRALRDTTMGLHGGWFPTQRWDGDAGDAGWDGGLDHGIRRVGGKAEHGTQGNRCQGNGQEPNTRGLLCGSVT